MNRSEFERTLTSRRNLLRSGAAIMSAASFRDRPTRAQTAETVPFDVQTPFALGAASGDPGPGSVVLWTRLMLDPQTGGALSSPVEVVWELATDENFKHVLKSGTETTSADFAHSLHVDATGLNSASTYFYRFLAGDAISPTGRTRTAPATDASVDRLAFAFASCANWEHGFFAAYGDLAFKDLDFVLFAGDYIYEYASGSDYRSVAPASPRQHTGGATLTLDDYRSRHALYKTDLNLQAAHLAFPWIVSWDDHEVENNYAGDYGPSGTEDFLARRAAAYQAYYENMPLRSESMPGGPNMQTYRRLPFGDLLELSVLDTRQYRSPQPCGNTIGPRCAAALDPASTMLGDTQKAWLFDGLTQSEHRWNCIAQQVMMSELTVSGLFPEPVYNDDQWDGYPLERNQLLGTIYDAGITNVVVLSGDVHSAWVNDLRTDYALDCSPVVATELVAASITAENPIGAVLAFAPSMNPSTKWLDLSHGYTQCTLTKQTWQADFRAVEDILDPTSPASTIATFTIETGLPGAQQ